MEISIPNVDDENFDTEQQMSSVFGGKFKQGDDMYVRPDQFGNYSYGMVGVEKVKAFTLHEMLLESLPQMDISIDNFYVFLLKIDVEGYDHQVLEGSIPFLYHRTHFILFEQQKQDVQKHDDFISIDKTLKLLWDNYFGCFVITGHILIPISDRWLNWYLRESLVSRLHDIFCGNLERPDLLHHAVETISLYAFPGAATSFEYRQRQFVHDAIEDYYVRRLGEEYKSLRDKKKDEIIEEYILTTRNSTIKERVAYHAPNVGAFMIGDSPEHWDQEKSLYFYQQAMNSSDGKSPYGIDAAQLQFFGEPAIRNKTAALEAIRYSVRDRMMAAYPIHQVLSGQNPN